MFLRHVYEIKKRLLFITSVLFLNFILFYHYSEEILYVIVSPLGVDKYLIFTNITEAFFSYINLAIYSNFIIIILISLYHLISFLYPGLYIEEKKRIKIYLSIFFSFFIIGNIIIYQMVIPSAWSFFLTFETTNLDGFLNIHLEAKINEYLDLFLVVFLLSNFFFQLPVILIIIINLNIISIKQLVNYRKVFLILSLILAAFCSPPDIFSQLILATPIIIFYESLVFFLFLQKKYKTYNLIIK